jgi:two-component system OmpR family sensor kinase
MMRSRPAGPWRRIRRAQLRTQVLAGVLTVTLVVLASFGFAAVTALRGYLLTRTDADLQAVLSEYEPLLGLPPGDVARPFGRTPEYQYRRRVGDIKSLPRNAAVRVRIPAVLDKYVVELTTGHGRVTGVVVGDADLSPRFPADLATVAAQRHGQTVTSTNGSTPLRLLAASADGQTLVVTTSLQPLDNTVGRMELIVAVGTLAVALLVSAGVGLVVRRGLRPVETMAAGADKITAGDLTSRVSPHDPATEVGRLGAALNGMLDRIQAAVREREASERATRQFLADASHELRTPLASLRANAELYQQGALATRTQVDEAIGRITAESRRMGTLVDDMLRLARLDQQPCTDDEPVDLSTLAAECAGRARTAGPHHHWRTSVAPNLILNGDEETLRRALDNLLANVAAHTPPGTTTTITAAAHADTITLEVCDDGPGVPDDLLPRVFDRFYRAPAEARHSGSGLGLAIVAAIAAAHRGTAEAAPNHPRGLRVTLTLPIDPSRGVEVAEDLAASHRTNN